MSFDQNKQSKKVDLDTILVEEIGEFGRYQIITLLITAVPIIFCGIVSAEYVFTTGRLPTRCLIPECDGPTPEFEPAWLGNAVPGSPGSYDDCSRFVNVSLPTAPPAAGTCPAELFDHNSTVRCDEYVYERTNTVVYDFGLECDEWRRTLIGSIRTIGSLFSLAISGYASDRWGRRITLSLNAFNLAWVGLARSFANSYEWFLALEVLENIIGGGTFSTCYVMVTEFVGPKYRVIAGPLVSTFIALGFVVLGSVAWVLPDWRNLTRALYGPQLIAIGYFWVMTESVRWLMSKGRFTEAEKILKKVARTNRTELSSQSLKSLRESAIAEQQNKKSRDSSEPSLLVQVCRSKTILKRCFITPFWWLSTILVYYGLSINAVNLDGNQYKNYIYVSAIEIPGYWTAILVLNRVGRKPTLIVGFLVCAACQFAFAFMPSGFETLALVLYLLGKYFISLVVTSIYLYTAELYPTKYRHTLFAFSSMIGRIGSIIAPLTPALMMYWAGIPSLIFGIMTLISGFLVFLTPETNNIKLPDTMTEAENLGIKPYVTFDNYDITS